MAEMIKLFVNGEEVEVESGKNLIDAIGAVGIEIPHLCYHPALGADGNCRMCLVGIEDGRPPLVPACKTPAVEGMKVQLDTDVIKKMSQTSGRVLVKLIDRETGESSYEIIKEMRGGFKAFVYQGVGKLYGADLKVRYDPKENEEDEMIERIVQMIIAGKS